MLTLFEVALFECLGISIHVYAGFIVLVLVLSDSGTRTRCVIVEYEYEYHSIEYEYERRQNSATSKLTHRVNILKTRVMRREQFTIREV